MILNRLSRRSVKRLMNNDQKFFFFLQGDIEYDSSSVAILSHSLGSGSLEPRGQISIRSLKSGLLNIQQDSSFELKDLKVFCYNKILFTPYRIQM